MGQEHPSKEYGGIYFKTDKPFYYSGDTVTGRIYIDLHKDYPGNLVHLHINGEEKTWWRERHHEGEETTYVEHHGSHHFYKNVFTVYDWHSDHIHHGQYEIPVAFVLKHHLPGTFSEH